MDKPEEKRTVARGAVWRAEDSTLVEWDPQETYVTRPWPKPRAWRRSASRWGKWEEVRGRVPRSAWQPPPLRRPLRPAELARRTAWGTVPAEVRQALEGAALAFHDWNTLALLARCPGALDLAGSVPVLAGALAACSDLRPKVARPWRAARALLRLPDGMARWRKVARWLGFDDSRAFVNVLRRMPAGQSFRSDDLRALRRVWADRAGRKRLLHTNVLSREGLRLLEGAMAEGVLDHVRAELVDAAAHVGRWGGLAGRFTAAAALHRHLHPRSPLPPWRTAEDVETAMLGLNLERTLRMVAESGPDVPRAFPPCPLPCAPGVEPLDSAEALVAEGLAMGHCIGGPNWAYSALHALGYGFRVRVGGQSGTLWLRRDRESAYGFSVDQLQGPGNATPAEPVRRAVAEWLGALAASPPALPEPWTREPASSDGFNAWGHVGRRWAVEDDLPPGPDDDIPF